MPRLLFHSCARPAEIPEKRIPGADLPVFNNRLRTIRIIKDQDFGLHENVTCATTCRMVRVTFDFSGSALVRFHQHAARIAGKGQCRGKKKRPSRNELFRLTNIRNDGPQRLPGASADTRRARSMRSSASRNLRRLSGSSHSDAPSGNSPGKVFSRCLATASLLKTLPIARFCYWQFSAHHDGRYNSLLVLADGHGFQRVADVPKQIGSGDGLNCRSNTSLGWRRNFSGWRWQSRHHRM